ncbi:MULTISPECIES: tRNA (adenosine(37)-N6)-threonylcarbamoyltransferase complex dimerization subunit type 1 TsaB [Hyphobacterium]|uniref:tRNA (Adenosine(37)-N6)-threonylcarbamoyltransferase complex dimerization subunit type 1 TsaB n=1 Tax=Hyphobacterium vulgare TaxID=1736751 RepID=A0ABV6ZXD0_9PROT
MRALLALDTTNAWCIAALRRPGHDDLVRGERLGRGHAERLAPLVAGLLADAGVEPSHLSRIGVATGPGSFAGTRVGVAFTRGLALATGAEAVGVSNLAVIAHMADPRRTGRVAVIHDAKRGELVVQLFDRGGAIGDPERLTIEAAASWLRPLADNGVRPAGSGAPILRAALNRTDWAGGVLADGPDLDPRTLLDLAGQSDAPPSPVYARPPDAKLPGGAEPE